ncbi:MAG: DUF1080 domain-containing protein [Ginsengibacter sp.]
MKYLFTRFFAVISLFTATANSYAQSATSPAQKDFIFSAIKGTVSKPDSVIFPENINSVSWTKGDTSAFNFAVNKKRNLSLLFAPSMDFTGIARATLQVKNSSGRTFAINLTGLSTKGLEGENEAPLSMIVDALGYKTDVGWTGLANHSRPELQGNEIPYQLFHKATKGKVEMIPVARYSPDFELPFGYYIDKNEAPDKHEVGVLAKAGTYPEHQILFPAIASGGHSFDPGDNSFGFYATGPTHTAYSEDVWNMLFFPANAVRATRIYPLKNANGNLLNNTYLVCFEEAKNGDFNDYVFLVKNIAPITTDAFTALFNGKNLNGFHTFLQGIGTNKDPDNNFKVEDGTLHVLGKDLGYAITEKPYNNFHLKVDFKWGEKRWPPRDTAKRDAGVCYNIGMNEPDSIWPSSIEFQVQEGDVGDFWLLGFSTIKVNGVQNVPANHTRMIKQKDNEKPKGEWNTIEIISYNGKCVHVVNGVVVNVGEGASVKDGRFLLQSEYSEIYYRNVKIRKL